ncbi:guanine nucleotide-binding protein alpha-1 subunit-like [Cajanus cajan]|uniref:guanine nucleotide-binding protein alpha-1 subunit-like n=1 Tax=Cajanus cajan TaxID=3821 RepID=UPI00098DA0E1|nr:guanine nucleotide-binding protein alpha-1 subunit-like [Cajanus cajan]
MPERVRDSQLLPWYDQTLFEDENINKMMETKELFEWVLKQPCFEKTSFMLFLNKFDIFEKKILKVPLNVCERFKDYQPVSTGKQEIEHAYDGGIGTRHLSKKGNNSIKWQLDIWNICCLIYLQ